MKVFGPRPGKKIQRRQLDLRERLWPGLDPNTLWNRLTHDGFSTIPSTMPLVMSIIDDLSNGQPASTTYLDLWTRAYDESFVTLAKPREMAFHAGFTSQRAERTWKQKLDVLAQLQFIDLKAGPSGPHSYALIRNPYLVIQEHRNQRTAGLRDDKFNALVARALEIGDLTFAQPSSPWPAPEATPAPASEPAPGSLELPALKLNYGVRLPSTALVAMLDPPASHARQRKTKEATPESAGESG